MCMYAIRGHGARLFVLDWQVFARRLDGRWAREAQLLRQHREAFGAASSGRPPVGSLGRLGRLGRGWGGWGGVVGVG